MTVADLLLLVLAAYRLVHLLVFDSLTESLRERAGITYARDDSGQVVDRVSANPAAALFNCHVCVGLLAACVVYGLWLAELWIVLYPLAVAGGALLLGRWQVSTRSRAEWWR